MEKELKPASATVIVIIFVAILFAAAATTVDAPSGSMGNMQGTDTGTDMQSGIPSGKDSMVPYTNEEFGIAFEYPSSLSIKEEGTPVQNPAELSLTFTKSIPRNPDGPQEIPGEGPNKILIEIKNNIDNKSIEEIAQSESTWNVAMTPLIKTEIGGMEAYEFYWSGLYEGRTVIIQQNGKIYSLSVDWLSTDDQLIRDFVMILNSLKV
ncbi:MAG TPA: PsbP-related protein [Candidatus Paceibacterota bacterium]